MLVLSRRAGVRIQIGDQIAVTVVRIGPGVVRIGIEAPAAMSVMREELRARPPASGTDPATTRAECSAPHGTDR